MTLIWLGLAFFFGFIAFISLRKGSYIRGGFALFAVALFAFAIWVDFQGAGIDEGSAERASTEQSDNPWASDS